ncbi:hypothetical protein SAMN05216308_101402 [Nitrosospira sp. Nsp13]|nr:hypothetical protein SAMN05216308_101402 [Nitrosospira sp. Nsp13]
MGCLSIDLSLRISNYASLEELSTDLSSENVDTLPK